VTSAEWCSMPFMSMDNPDPEYKCVYAEANMTKAKINWWLRPAAVAVHMRLRTTCMTTASSSSRMAMQRSSKRKRERD